MPNVIKSYLKRMYIPIIQLRIRAKIGWEVEYRMLHLLKKEAHVPERQGER